MKQSQPHCVFFPLNSSSLLNNSLGVSTQGSHHPGVTGCLPLQGSQVSLNSNALHPSRDTGCFVCDCRGGSRFCDFLCIQACLSKCTTHECGLQWEEKKILHTSALFVCSQAWVQDVLFSYRKQVTKFAFSFPIQQVCVRVHKMTKRYISRFKNFTWENASKYSLMFVVNTEMWCDSLSGN